MVCLSSIVDLDASIGELHDLPYGWAAERKSPKHKWKRFKYHPFPSFEEQGYYLEDVVVAAAQRDDLNPPSERRLENCQVGDHVKLLFRFAAEDSPRQDFQTERMWVEITDIDEDGGYFTGAIANDPNHSAAALGDELQFHPHHIAEILKKRKR